MNRVKLITMLALVALLGACQAPAPETNQASTEAPQSAEPSPLEKPARATDILSSADSDIREEDMLRDSYFKCVESSNGVTWDMQMCIEEEFEYQDARLNAAYQKLQAVLPEAQKLGVHDDQRQWVSSKDEECKWDAETEGQAQRIEANVCSLKKIAIRANELEEMARVGDT